MKTSLIQEYINKIDKYKQEIKNLEKLIELNMDDMHDIVDQRDWYYDRYRQLKDKYNKYD
jgi:hypothetical protein